MAVSAPLFLTFRLAHFRANKRCARRGGSEKGEREREKTTKTKPAKNEAALSRATKVLRARNQTNDVWRAKQVRFQLA